jgi:hypothetical protein
MVCLLAIAIGFVAPYALVLASVSISHLIDPSARIAAFLLIPPQHPTRLAAATLTAHVVFGGLSGSDWPASQANAKHRAVGYLAAIRRRFLRFALRRNAFASNAEAKAFRSDFLIPVPVIGATQVLRNPASAKDSSRRIESPNV